MSELTVLQAVRLKGRVSEAGLAAALGIPLTAVAETIAPLVESGLLVAGKTVKVSPEGRDRLATLLAEERSAIDQAAMASAYDQFRIVNGELKSLVSDWQIRNDEPNTHEDANYDESVLTRLGGVHDKVLPIIAAVTAQIPRLGSYADRLSAAYAKITVGETMWFIRPMIDSYHTVWFELHEELILAAGLTREDEAKAGHAQ
jgi:hypothetical protein